MIWFMSLLSLMIGLLFRWFIPLRMQGKAQGRIFSLYDMERISEEELETQVYQNAKDGLTILSNKLGLYRGLFGGAGAETDMDSWILQKALH